MHKHTLLFFAPGLIVGAAIGFAVNNLAIGIGLSAALGLLSAQTRRRENS